jgi:ABC-type uncharacterized transport system permease subunit
VDDVLIGSLIASTLRVATPLILCALASVLSERAGVIDLGLEGKMLATAFAAASVGALSGSLGLAMLAAVAVGLALSMLHGFACVSHRGDQVVMGMAITMTAAGLTVVLGIAWFKQGGQTPPLSDAVRMGAWFSGAAEALREVPLLGATVRWSMPRLCWSAGSGGCSIAHAWACACAPPARTRRWSMRPASRCSACATWRWPAMGCWRRWPAASWCWLRTRSSSRT